MKKKFFYVDFIRIVAVFLVILLHTTGLHLAQWKTISPSIWMTENVYDAFTRMSVPIFVMLSGALLLNKEETFYNFFKKRFSKIFIPFIFWVGVYLCWRIFFLKETLGIKGILYTVFTGPVYYHLWYLYMLVGLYLMTPIIRKITKNSTEKELLYFIGLWIVFISIFPTLLYIFKLKYNISLQFGIVPPLLVGHIGYYILGHYLNKREYKQFHIVFCWIGLIATWMVTTFGTLYFTRISNGFNDIFYSYFSPTVALEAICGFILLMHYGNLLEKSIPIWAKEFSSNLGNASFGVYLVHPLILDLLLKGKLFYPVSNFVTNPITTIPIATCEVMVISYFIIFILLKLPILKYTVGGSASKFKQYDFPDELKQDSNL